MLRASTGHSLLVCGCASLLIWSLFHARLVAYAECLCMIFAYEYNAIANRGRQARGKENLRNATTGYVACCIGYQESKETFRSCLRSYMSGTKSCAALVVMLDGTVDENADMVAALREETGVDGRQALAYEEPLGVMCDRLTRQLRTSHTAEALDVARAEAFEHVCEYVRRKLRPRLLELSNSKAAVPILLVSQPHVGMKEVRLAAWVTSIELASLGDVRFMWSSDSDSFITESCVERAVATLAGDERAGGASTALAVRRTTGSLLNRVYAGFYRCGVYLLRTSAACVGKSTCVTGPSACYRTRAIKPLLYEWYSQTVFGRKMWVNEDAHMTTLLAREGWLNYYVSDALVYSEAPDSWHSWFKQLIRWERAQHLERLASLSDIFSPAHGLVALLVHLREATLMIFLLVHVTVFALTGICVPQSYPGLGAGLLVSQLVQNVWNTLRSPEPHKDPLGCLMAAMLYLVAYPFAHVWSLLTLFADSWDSSTKRLSSLAADAALFAVWLGICAVSVARILTLES